MDTIILHPTDARQFSFLKELMEKLSVSFTIKKDKKKDDSLFTKEEYFAMLDASIQEAKEGKVHRMKESQSVKEFLTTLCTK